MSDAMPNLPWNEPGGFEAASSEGNAGHAATCKMCGGVIEGWPESCPHCGEEFIRQAPRPHFSLFSVPGIVLGTFLGSLFAGSVLLALNARKLGQSSLTWAAPVVGFVLTIGLMLGAAFLPAMPPMILVFAQMAAVYFVAERLQGESITEHRKARGKISSNWAAAGLSILCIVPLFVLFIGLLAVIAVVFPEAMTE